VNSQPFTKVRTCQFLINAVEKEIGFKIFDRSGKGTSMTPAGSQFTTSLRGIRDELRKAIEQGQNFSTQYQENIRIVLPIRSALYFLPEAIRNVAAGDSGILISPSFDWHHGIDAFLQGEQDILFAVKDEVSHISDIQYFNSDDHDTSLTNVAAGRAIVLSPGLCSLIHSAVQRIVSPFS
jgi:hypothetical protein